MTRALRLCLVLAVACGGAPTVGRAAPRGPAISGRQARKPPARASSRRASPPPTLGAGTVEKVRLRWEVAAGGTGRAVAVDGVRGRVAYGNEQAVRVFRLRDGGSIRTLRPCAQGAVLKGGLGYTAQGRLIVVCSGRVRSYAPRSARYQEVKVHGSRLIAAHVQWPHLTVGHRDGVVRVYDLKQGTVRPIPVPGPPIDVKSLALSRDGKRVAVAWIQGSIWWWDVATPEAPHRLVRHEREADAVAFTRDGRRLVEEGAAHETQVWDLAAGKVTARLRHGAWLKRLLLTPDDQWIVRGGSDGLELAELGGPKRIVLDSHGKVEDAALDAAGRYLVAADRAGRLTAWTAR